MASPICSSFFLPTPIWVIVSSEGVDTVNGEEAEDGSEEIQCREHYRADFDVDAIVKQRVAVDVDKVDAGELLDSAQSYFGGLSHRDVPQATQSWFE